MNIQIQYGKDTLNAQLPRQARVRILTKGKTEHPQDGDEIIAEALTHPIGSQRLKHMVDKEEQVVIVTSDITRPFPTAKVLPHVIREMERGGEYPCPISRWFLLWEIIANIPRWRCVPWPEHCMILRYGLWILTRMTVCI